MSIIIKKVTSPSDLQHCLEIRTQVFVKGQNVPINQEIDGKDPISEHYLLLVDDKPAGVARVRFVENSAKIERVAISDEHQNQGLGKQLMNVILSDLKKLKTITAAKLSSQTYAIPFYEKLGFHVYGEEYQEAGIPHKDMMLSFHKNFNGS